LTIEGVNEGIDSTVDRNAFNDTADFDPTLGEVGIGTGGECDTGHNVLLIRLWSLTLKDDRTATFDFEAAVLKKEKPPHV
jgi:hypothetical protein